MDNTRLILFFGLSLVVLLLWQAWQEDYGQPPTEPAPVVQNGGSPGDVPSAVPPAAPPAGEQVPQAPAPDAPPAVAKVLPTGKQIEVRTDVFRVVIDTYGGNIREADLLQYPVSEDTPDEPFPLLTGQDPYFFVAQSGLLSSQPAPDHYAQFEASQTEYALEQGQGTLTVPLRWTSPDGIVVTKTYTFHRDSYVVELDQTVENRSAEPWQGRQYRQFQRSSNAPATSRFIITYTGGVIYTPEGKYEKVDFDDMEENALNRVVEGGWVAMIQHYFLGAWLPASQDAKNLFYTKAPGEDRYIIGMVSDPKVVAAGGTETFNAQLYVGPKIQATLEELAPGLELTVDYGVLTFIAKPLFWLLDWIHGWIGNWGWAIVILTFIIKLAFYKLSAASYRSMANMRRLTPKLQALRERYGDDRQRMSQAMMDMYKKEKINPLGGCLPMLVQIPVFIALYWVLLESVELRQADFILWINDLSEKDPFYVLPLLMGATMFVQQKLHPPPPDPVQAKVMMALPFVFTLFFAFFPAGLVLYWVVNNVLSIAQQWYVMSRVEKASRKE